MRRPERLAVPCALIRRALAGLAVGMLGFPCLAGAQPGGSGRTAALIQTRGLPLRAGVLRGGGQIPLERAAGGDTPILTFRAPRGVLRLLLDTGAAATLVTPAVVQRFSLASRPLPPKAFSLAGGGEDCPALAMASAFLPPLTLSAGQEGPTAWLAGVEALVIPSTPLPPGVDGVLGAPVLRQLPVVVDPQAQTVALGRDALRWRQARPSPLLVLPLVWRRGVPLLPLHVRSASGGAPERRHALADTGAEGLFLQESLAQRLLPLHPPQPAVLVGVCGRQPVRRQRLLGLGLGADPSLTEMVDAVILANPVFAALGVEAIAGQELWRGRPQLWRLDADPPRLELW